MRGSERFGSMGANQSSRTVTVVQDEATGVIKISDSVVQRLKGEISGEQPQQSAPKQQQQQSTASSPPQQQQQIPPPPPPSDQQPPAPNQVWQRPIIQYIEEPSISALRVKAEKEEEMKTMDDYWRDRLQKQEVCWCCVLIIEVKVSM